MDEFMENLIKELHDRLGDGYEVRQINCLKNNHLNLRGVSVSREGHMVAPTIYVDRLYLDYLQGLRTMQGTVDMIIKMYNENPSEEKLSIDFRNYNQIKDGIRLMLLNYEANREMLQNRPHRRFLDLAAVAYLTLKNAPEAFRGGTIQIQNGLFQTWGISEEELFEQGLQNMSEEKEISSIASILDEAPDLDDETKAELEKSKGSMGMYVVSNKRKIYGAGYLLDNLLFQKMAEEKNVEILIYPSSVHELIVVPTEDIDAITAKIGTLDVEEINQTQVEPEERLSNSIYRYDRNKKEVIIWKEGNPLLAA